MGASALKKNCFTTLKQDKVSMRSMTFNHVYYWQVSPEPQLVEGYNIRLKQLGSVWHSSLFNGSIRAKEKLFYNIETR
jgi:hypothetical protein